MLTLCVNIIGYLSPAFLGPEGYSRLLICGDLMIGISGVVVVI